LPAAGEKAKAMTHLASSSSSLAAGTAHGVVGARDDERLPIPQAALIVVTLSLGLWAGIGLLVRWLVVG
jgi:hypothetical protein